MHFEGRGRIKGRREEYYSSQRKKKGKEQGA
jgi:hypothetical protein